MARTSTDHKEGKATVKTVYYTSKTLADGSHPFMVRISKNRKLKYIATGLSLHPKYWNEAKKEIRKSYPEPYREQFIMKLAEWERKYADAANSLAGADEQHDAKAVAVKAIEGRKQARRVKLLTYIDELVAAMVTAKQVGNSTVYRDLRNQVADFLCHEQECEADPSDIPFDAINVAFCNRLETYLRGRGNTDTTLSNRYRTLRAVLNKAIAEGVTKSDHYPFARNVAERHKFSVGKFDTSTVKRAVSRDDIRLIENYQPAGTATGKWAAQQNDAQVERLKLAKEVFLFSFYCGGINFVDLAALRWKNVTTDSDGNSRLSYVRQKTGGKFALRLLGPAKAIIDAYQPETGNGAESYVFPILNATTHKNANQIKNRTHKILGQVNSDLKTIGEQCGITTPLTTYTARHSFATSLKKSGVATAVISEMMGHQTEAVTAVYLDSFASDTVDAAYDFLL
ncbi:site-specific integrase [Fibrella sp. HMF5335]|uniref:Site-specific integrase n=1 Tax=Fibrella rubiginis TaxID=2817060 RepID=A0A939GKF3_9BACT|nr:site-specific integrase [Fibrella rubiginis]MBO0939961.1 site-specific integrase [Fibrella rubiginis]